MASFGQLALHARDGVSETCLHLQGRHDLYADQLDDVAKNMDRIITKTGQKPDKKKSKRSGTRKKKQVNRGGPGWDRTSDLPRVKRTLSH